MKYQEGGLVLSRRNLLTLLSKLDNDDSPATLHRWDGKRYLIVQAEDDAEHYGERPAGQVRAEDDPGRSDGGPVEPG